MVKGLARRVVLIKSPDPKLFDEAIFIVREESGRGDGVTYDQLLREAQDVAENFVRSRSCPIRRRPLPWWVGSLMGGGAVGAAWILTLFL